MSGDGLQHSLGVLASLLLSTPFASVYTAHVYDDEVTLQCHDFNEGRRNAELWGLSGYDYAVSDTGREFHRWTGRVYGAAVRLTASPDEAVGCQDPSSHDLLDPAEALQSLVRANATEPPDPPDSDTRVIMGSTEVEDPGGGETVGS